MQEDHPSEPDTLLHGKPFRDFLLAKVRQAGREILIATHTLEFDAFGQSLLSELEYACQRGLRVHCLLHPRGSRVLIRDHPALLRELESRFRLQNEGTELPRCIVFDRELALLDTYDLCESSPTRTEECRIVHGVTAAALADSLEVAWKQAVLFDGTGP